MVGLSILVQVSQPSLALLRRIFAPIASQQWSGPRACPKSFSRVDARCLLFLWVLVVLDFFPLFSCMFVWDEEEELAFFSSCLEF